MFRGAFHLKENNRLNLNIHIIHATKHTSADTLLKAVVEGNAQANISGKKNRGKGIKILTQWIENLALDIVQK